jgi:hypothetical protein
MFPMHHHVRSDDAAGQSAGSRSRQRGGARNVFFAARQRWGGVELAAAMTNTEWGGGILRASGDPCLAIVWS